jgi:hypothetical protein
MHCKLPKTLARQNASQLTRTPCPVLRKCFVRQLVEFTGTRIPLDRRIELSRFELLEPSSKTRKFFGGELFDGSFNFFRSGHFSKISLLQLSRKGAGTARENLTVPDRAFADASFGRDL